MSVLLDTHVLLWTLAGSSRLKELPRLKDFPSWTLSPISFLEIKFLQECGRLKLNLPEILKKLHQDDRFLIDSPSLEGVCLAALDLSWTRDPFDRLLVAHSKLRSIPLATVDQNIHLNYSEVI